MSDDPNAWVVAAEVPAAVLDALPPGTAHFDGVCTLVPVWVVWLSRTYVAADAAAFVRAVSAQPSALVAICVIRRVVRTWSADYVLVLSAYLKSLAGA